MGFQRCNRRVDLAYYCWVAADCSIIALDQKIANAKIGTGASSASSSSALLQAPQRLRFEHGWWLLSEFV